MDCAHFVSTLLCSVFLCGFVRLLCILTGINMHPINLFISTLRKKENVKTAFALAFTALCELLDRVQ